MKLEDVMEGRIGYLESVKHPFSKTCGLTKEKTEKIIESSEARNEMAYGNADLTEMEYHNELDLIELTKSKILNGEIVSDEDLFSVINEYEGLTDGGKVFNLGISKERFIEYYLEGVEFNCDNSWILKMDSSKEFLSESIYDKNLVELLKDLDDKLCIDENLKHRIDFIESNGSKIISYLKKCSNKYHDEGTMALFILPLLNEIRDFILDENKFDYVNQTMVYTVDEFKKSFLENGNVINPVNGEEIILEEFLGTPFRGYKIEGVNINELYHKEILYFDAGGPEYSSAIYSPINENGKRENISHLPNSGYYENCGGENLYGKDGINFYSISESTYLSSIGINRNDILETFEKLGGDSIKITWSHNIYK